MTGTPNADRIMSMIKSVLSERFGIAANLVSEATTLRDLGLDSIQVLDIMISMEELLSASLIDLSLPPNPSLRDVAALIEQNLPGASAPA